MLTKIKGIRLMPFIFINNNKNIIKNIIKMIYFQESV
jgi:hypothetical protein